MADLYVVIGIPGSGKTTFLNKYVNKETSAIISRDETRFSLLKDGEDYFSHEKEVYNILWNNINNELAAGRNVFVDQTSLTIRSRKWLIKHVKGYHHLNALWIDTPLEICLERNEKRKGTKTYVPRFTITNMKQQFKEPSLEEGFYRIFRFKNNKLTYKGVIL